MSGGRFGGQTSSIMRCFLVCAGFMLCIHTGAWAAGPPSTAFDIPPELSVWKSWVLYGMDENRCPDRYDDAGAPVCAWPSRLTVTADAHSGTFDQQWTAFRDMWVQVPGSLECYPNDVKLDGNPAPVMLRDQKPVIRLPEGSHHVTGVFAWKDIPETIMASPDTALVSLLLNGQPVAQPVLDVSGRLWIQRKASAAVQENRMDVRIFRLLTDSIPMMTTSRLRLDVSGQTREVRLENVLLRGAIPQKLTSPIPAGVTPDGVLTVQVRPGRWTIDIESRMEHPVAQIAAGACKYGTEIWSWESRDDLRMVAVSGAAAIDPGQGDVPPEWRRFPAYRIVPETTLHFQQLRRGDSDPAPDQLHMTRTWWLDFDGAGFTLQDHITGTLTRQWHLAMASPGVLGRVAVDGVDRLITAQPPDGRPGVELRNGHVQMEADSRISGPLRRLPVANWEHVFQTVSGVLNLPPGWKLLAATGADITPLPWIENWSLLDLFLVLIVSIAVYRLHSPLWGILALITLALTWHEPGAPRNVWLSLLAASALLRVIPGGWMQKAVRMWSGVSIVALVAIGVPFMVQQIRIGLYPQLDIPMERYYNAPVPVSAPAQKARNANLKGSGMDGAPRSLPLSPRRDKMAEAVSGMMMALSTASAPPAQDPDALIQTGPGLPTWKWRSFALKWNGAVAPSQTLSLWLISPAVNLLLALLRILLLTALAAGVCGADAWAGRLRLKRFVAAGIFVFLISGISAYAAGAPGNATPRSFPPQELLKEFQTRLLKKPDCFPACADMPRMELQVSPTALRILIEVHAAVDTAVPLPGAVKGWRPDTALIDQKPLGALFRDTAQTSDKDSAKSPAKSPDGLLWALIPQGVHHIVLSGSTGKLNEIQLTLPVKPRQVTISGSGWDVQGIQPDGQISGGVQLYRTEPQKSSGDVPVTGALLPPFFQVQRVLRLNLTWQVLTTVTRMTPPGAAATLQLPLIAGESVVTPGIHVDQGKVMISFDPDTREVRLESRIETSDHLSLTAPDAVPWTESWTLEASPVWHCRFSGIPPIHHQDTQGQWQPEWRPWPGEHMEIQVSRPKAVPGVVVTIDSAHLRWTPGDRLNAAALSVVVRTSRGGQHTLELPENALLQKVLIQGRLEPIRQKGRQVTVPLVPGVQTIVLEWQEPSHLSVSFHPAPPSIGGPAVNADVVVQMPEHRWILWASGPRLGPAVLFWGYLIVILLVAVLLAATSITPLRYYDWLLLGVGLTQIPPFMAMGIAGWLLALGVRNTIASQESPFRFNLIQWLLLLWSASALGGLYMAVENGLMGIPDMQIAGNHSTGRLLNWTQDRIAGLMPDIRVISLPLWVFHVLMLCWSLWLAFSLLTWLKWGWRCFCKDGVWKKVDIRWRKTDRFTDRGDGQIPS